MNKLLASSLALLLLAGCSSSADSGTTGGSVETSTGGGGETASAAVATDDGEITATVEKSDGKITKVVIDEIEDNTSKKDLGDDYGLKDASGINKEWYEQINYLENFIVNNGIDAVKLDAEGYAEDEDLKAGCTINLTEIMKAVDEANAKIN